MCLLKQDDIEVDNERVIRVVDKAVNQIVGRLENLAMFDGVNSKVSRLGSVFSGLYSICWIFSGCNTGERCCEL